VPDADGSFQRVLRRLKEPLSLRALEDVRQTDLIQQAWAESGKVYGYRKLHDDLLDAGETCSENRVARLASLAGIAAQIGYKRRPGRYGGKPAIVADNMLDRHHLHQDARRLVVPCCRHRPVLKAYCWVVHAIPDDNGPRLASIVERCLAAQTKEQSLDPFRPRLTIHQQGVAIVPRQTQIRRQHEQTWKLP